jgi:hypothetical protein
MASRHDPIPTPEVLILVVAQLLEQIAFGRMKESARGAVKAFAVDYATSQIDPSSVASIFKHRAIVVEVEDALEWLLDTPQNLMPASLRSALAPLDGR